MGFRQLQRGEIFIFTLKTNSFINMFLFQKELVDKDEGCYTNLYFDLLSNKLTTILFRSHKN